MPALDGVPLSLARIHSDPPLAGAPIAGLKFSPASDRLCFLRGSETDSEVLDLWAIDLNVPDGAPHALVRTRDLITPEGIALSEQERMALERKRIRHRGITSYSFCGEAGDALLFPLSGDLYHVKLNPGAKPTVTRLTDDGKPKLDVRCSPKGTYVSYISAFDVHTIDVATRKHRQLTRGGSPTRTHGVSEFVAQEEMGRYEGHYWSPSERYVAYLDVDLSPVTVKTRSRIYADRTELFEQHYPAAGEPNAIVKVRVVDLKTGRDVEVKTPKEDGYIPRVGFTPSDGLYVQWQSRDQTRVALSVGEAPSFVQRELLLEEDLAWVEITDDLRFLSDGSFVWSSERSGVRQLFLYDPDGTPRPITMGHDPVDHVVTVDEKGGRIYYTRSVDRGRQRQLFVTHLSKSDAGPAAEQPITRQPGWHRIIASPDGSMFVDAHSRLFVPETVTVIDTAGQPRQVLKGLDETRAWQTYAKPTALWGEVKASDGTVLNTLLFAPQRRVPGERYPVLVYVYGGPTAQVVVDRWSRLQPFFAYLTQRGIGVFFVDNRGSGGRDRAFGRAIKNRFGDIEVEDQLRALSALDDVAWVDTDRLGVWGWSYGGYLSALLVLEENTPFAAAAAVAPVTDWSLYDTHYTERYIGTPADNEAVYARAGVVARAGHLTRPFLLMHGMADDNVLFENSLMLMQALQEKSLPFSLMVYPGRAHGLRGRGTQQHVFRMLSGFFDEKLCHQGGRSPCGRRVP